MLSIYLLGTPSLVPFVFYDQSVYHYCTLTSSQFSYLLRLIDECLIKIFYVCIASHIHLRGRGGIILRQTTSSKFILEKGLILWLHYALTFAFGVMLLSYIHFKTGFVTPVQIKLLAFNSFSYNAIKSYKTEGRAERLEATEYLVSAAEAGKAMCEI